MDEIYVLADPGALFDPPAPSAPRLFWYGTVCGRAAQISRSVAGGVTARLIVRGGAREREREESEERDRGWLGG